MTAPRPEPARTRRGQPLRFLAVVLALWASGRLVVASAWLESPKAAAIAASLTIQNQKMPIPPRAYANSGRVPQNPSRWAARIEQAPIAHTRALWAPQIDRAPVFHRETRQTALAIAQAPDAAALADAAPALAAPASLPAPGAAPPRALRWSGSAWLFWRENGGGAALSQGQLGGPQAGLRIERRLLAIGAKAMPVLFYGRATNALKTPHQGEAALGVALRPASGRMPLTIGIERRFALDRTGRNAFALLMAGGLNPTRIRGPLMAEGYAQAGMVGLSRRDMFADGRIALSVPLDKAARTHAGMSLSGGAQPGVARLDIGPMVEARMPIGPLQTRLVMEWRQRVAGHARPGSGVSVTLASDF